ncbi:MAG: hypothetical protein JW940_07655 [Polyangiaceae bacterium]|nr:hypothetical protein [Polyangiaceae bacterium]
METVKEVRRVAAQLKQWDAKLYELAAKVDEADAEATVGYRRRVVDLKAEHRMLRARLLELKGPDSVRLDTFWAGMRLELVRRRLQEADALAETRG